MSTPHLHAKFTACDHAYHEVINRADRAKFGIVIPSVVQFATCESGWGARRPYWDISKIFNEINDGNFI